MKKAFIDLETTGLDHQRSAIIQMGMILDIAGVVSEYEWFIKPFDGAVVDPKALEVSGFTTDQIEEFTDQREVHRAICMELGSVVNKFVKRDKLFFIGYNAWFDYQFARQLFTRCNDKFFGSYFHWPPIDVAGALAAHHPTKWATLPNRKLATITPIFLGPDHGLTFHDAMDDIRATRLLWNSIQGGEV